MKKLLACIALLFLGTTFYARNEPREMKNEAIVRAMFEAFNQHEWQKMASFYDEQARFLDPSYGPGYIGRSRQQTVEHYRELEKMFPDIKDELTDVIASGNKVVVQFLSTGTAPDGTQWHLPICTVFTLKDGEIVVDATYYDNATPGN